MPEGEIDLEPAELNTSGWRLLLFGASGAIGQAVFRTASALGWSVTSVSRTARPDTTGQSWLQYDPAGAGLSSADFASHGPFDAVCWAQGENRQDSVLDFDAAASAALYEANCLYIARSLNELLAANLLSPAGARLCVVSSIWQERARR